MYNERVIKEFSNPQNVGEMKDANAVGTVGNATCGDIMKIFMKINDDGVIEDVSFQTFGCGAAIATSSVATSMIKGKTVDEAMKLAETFHKLMESRGKGLNDEQAEESLEDGIVFQGVSQYPMRIKCALLGWEGMKDAVAKALAAKA